jgi:integrase
MQMVAWKIFAGRGPDRRVSGNVRARAARALDAYVGSDATALVFTGLRGGVLRRGNFRKASSWSDAVAAIGLPELHFHDLRHTGNTLAAHAE